MSMKHFRLWAVCLALLPLAVCPASGQVPPQAPSPTPPRLTGTVAKISIVGLKNISLNTVQAKLTLKVSDAYTPEAAQKDADALKSMGVFNGQVMVAATPASPSGVDLAYTVRENPVIRSIHITANTPNAQPSIPPGELFAQMKTCVGQVLNTNVLVNDLNGLFNHTDGYAFKQGYIMDVSSDINIDPMTGILTIPLVEAHIKSVEVTGNSRVKTADIMAQMHTKVGDIFNNAALLQDASALYEDGSFRTVNYTWNIIKPGDLDLNFSIVEQPAATGRLDEKQGKVIPFLYDPITIPTPVIQVSINGHSPLPFIVDTGCTTGLLMNPWAAKKLGLHVDDLSKKADNYAYQTTSVQDVILMGLKNGANADFGIQPAQVTDLNVIDQTLGSQYIAGVVGLGLLQSVTSRFDFAARTLTIFTSPHPPLSVPDGTILPLKTSSTGVLDVRATLAPNTYADLIFDTGSSSTQVPLSSLKSLHPAAIASSGGGRVDFMFVCPELRLAALDFGLLHVPNVVVSVLPPQMKPSLGLDILAGYRLILDGPNGQLILEPSRHSGRYATGHSGLEVKRVGESWFVSALTLGMPAQKSGLRVGDKVLAVGGAGARELTMLRISGRLSGLAGVPVQVLVRRGTKRLTVSWIPGDDFSSPRSVMDGISMTKAPGGPWIVADTLKGCAGDLAGLRVGDKITYVDRQAVANIPMSSYGGEETKAQLTALLVVERPGVAQPFTVRLTAPKPPVSKASQ